MFQQRLLPLICICLLCLATTVLADPVAYISDQLEVPVRTGTSIQHRIIKMLSSGSAVEVLASEAGEGYAQVRMADGSEGYVLSRYLMRQPSARDRLAAVEPRLAELRATNAELREREQALTKQLATLDASYQALQTSNQALTLELEEIKRVSAQALELRDENSRLSAELEQQQAALQREVLKSQRLQNSTDRKWFVTGAGVTLLSLFLGLIIPRIPWRRRRRWGDL